MSKRALNFVKSHKISMLFIFISATIFLFCYCEEDVFNVVQYVRENGYPAENHTVLTEDGYLLTLFRIPYGRNHTELKNRKVVLMNHGLTSSSGDFLILGPNTSLGFLLADSGYDVWLTNARGTTYSKKHLTIDEKHNKKEFYNFSWHEIGMYDIPASVDYILNKTENTELYFVGHSQGTTTFLVMNTMRPEYNKKIKFAVLLAPIVFLRNVGMEYKIFAAPINAFFSLVYKLNFFDIPLVDTIRYNVRRLCKRRVFYPFCYTFYNLNGGYADPEQTVREKLPLIFRTYPSNIALRQADHFIQLMRSKKFCPYDFGTEKNLQVYGKPEPDDYNLDLVTVPLVIYAGENDRYSRLEDDKLAASKLKSIVDFKIIDHEHWNHFDFGFAKDVVKLLYQDVINTMAMY